MIFMGCKLLKNILTSLVSISLLTGCTSLSAPQALTITDNGSSHYTIVIGDKASDTELMAAKILKDSIKSTTGVEIQLVKDADNRKSNNSEIIIGKTAIDNADILSANNKLSESGYVIQVSGKKVFIAGKGDEGTIYGVKAFINEFISKDKNKTISIPSDTNIVKMATYPVAGVTICGNDLSKYKIVKPQKATEPENKAAEQLQYYLYKATGSKPGIVDDSTENTDGFEILIGNVSRKQSNEIDKKDLGEEGFVIRTSGNSLVICGGGDRGTLYGTYTFLEDYIGCRWYASKYEIIKASTRVIDIKSDTNVKEMPALEYRDVYWFYAFNEDWSVKQKINSNVYMRNLGSEDGGGINYAGQFVHTIADLSETNVNTCKQPCFSDPQILETVIENVKKSLKANKDAKIVSVSTNDNNSYCACEKCSAIDNAEGSHMGSVLTLVNSVADAISADYPDVMVDTIAYLHTTTPPKTIKPRKNVIIRLCSINCDFSHAIDKCSTKDTADFVDALKGWSKICNNIYIWDYNTNFSYYLSPFPNIDGIYGNMNLFANSNVKGILEEGNFNSKSGEFGELKAYLLAKLLWNPKMSYDDYNGYINDFLEGYYGAGWMNIRKYIDSLEEATKDINFTIYSKPDEILPKSIGENFMKQADAWWDAAEAAVENSIELEHIRRSRLQVEYYKLYVSRGNMADKCQKFYDKLVENGIGYINELIPLNRISNVRKGITYWGK